MNRLFALLLILAGASAHAQFDFGLKGGVSSTGVIFEDFEDSSVLEDLTSQNDFGWHAGVYARVKILAFYLQPEFLYTSMSSEISAKTSSGSQTESFNLNRLDIPVNLGLKIGPASVFGGPVMSYNLNSPSEIFDVDYTAGSLGYQAGLGLTLGNFIIDLKYEGSFQSISNEVVIGGDTYEVDARTGQVILSLGYALF